MPLLGQDLSGPLSRSTAILGPGLIGGSLAMALLRRDPGADVRVWARRPDALPNVSERIPGCRATSDLAEAVRDADLVVLCTPPQAVEESGPALAEWIRPDCVVTDAASVKEKIVTSLESSLGGRFVGAHPMAGSEQSGIGAARADLFQGAVCLITPTPQTLPDAHEAVRNFWLGVGCVLHELPPSAHDHAVARISHLPHAAAAAIVQAALGANPEVAAFAGNGYLDTTRIAAGPASLWTEILLDNRKEVIDGILDLQVSLGELKTFLERGDRAGVEAFLSKARDLRSAQRNKK